MCVCVCGGGYKEKQLSSEINVITFVNNNYVNNYAALFDYNVELI